MSTHTLTVRSEHINVKNHLYFLDQLCGLSMSSGPSKRTRLESSSCLCCCADDEGLEGDPGIRWFSDVNTLNNVMNSSTIVEAKDVAK